MRISVQLQPRRHVVVNRHGRKRIRPLKHHAHAAADLHRLRVAVDVHVADAHRAGDARDRIGLVHAVQAAHKRALAAARRTNQRSRMVGRNVQVDVLQRVVGSVPRIQVHHLDADAHLACPFQNSAAGHSTRTSETAHHNQCTIRHQRARPRQPMPVIVRAGRIHIDLQRQRRNRLIRIRCSRMHCPSAVKISGAVSPATRANASMQPVMMPGDAVFTVMESTERQFGTPKSQRRFANACSAPSAASLRVVRVTVGIIMMPSATPPEKAEK